MTKQLVLTLLAGFCLANLAFSNDEPLEKWSEHYPEASKALGQWVKNHPDVASKFFEWDGHHTERTQEFVTWSIEHSDESVLTFAHMYPNEPYMDELVKARPVAHLFMLWCQKNPEAARALMAHPKGLEWAGHHLYMDYWNTAGAGK